MGGTLLEHSDEMASQAAVNALREYIASQGGKLPDGFSAKVHIRTQGISHGGKDTYFYGPDGTKYRSKTEVLRALGLAPARASGGTRTASKEKSASRKRAAASSGSSVAPLGENGAAQQLLQALEEYLQSLGGSKLEAGWKASIKMRQSGTRSGSYDAYYISPGGDLHRSRLSIARSLGLLSESGEPRSPGPDVQMAVDDAAELLMELCRANNPLSNPHKKQKVDGAGTPVQHVANGEVQTPTHRTPAHVAGDAEEAGPLDTSGLTTMADATGLVSPMRVDGPQEVAQSTPSANGVAADSAELSGAFEAAARKLGLPWGLGVKEDLSKEPQGSPGVVTIEATSLGSLPKASRGTTEGGKQRRPKKNADAAAGPSNGKQKLASKGSPAKRSRGARGQVQPNYQLLDTLADVQYTLDAADEKKRAEGEAELKRARKERKQAAKDNCGSAFSKLVGRVRAQISRIRQEELLIQAYDADGWRGGNKEKFKPTAEIERARQQIQKSRDIIREAVKYCEESEGDKPIPQDLFDDDEEIDECHIFCSKCHLLESTDGNDIVMCDGNCNRAYHEKCVIPNLVAADLEEDEGWLCPGCDTKVDIIDLLNKEFSSEYELDTPWQDVLAHVHIQEALQQDADMGDMGRGEGAPLHSLTNLLQGQDLPESDPEDSDFREDGDEAEEGEVGSGGPGQGSEGGSDNSGSSDGEEDSNSDGDSEACGQGGGNATGEGKETKRYVIGHRTRSRAAAHPDRVGSGVEDAGELPEEEVMEDEEEAPEALILTGKRRRRNVDYSLLNALVFGDAGDGLEGEASDEDFDIPEEQLRRVNSG